jgi:hypothetical protein
MNRLESCTFKHEGLFFKHELLIRDSSKIAIRESPGVGLTRGSGLDGFALGSQTQGRAQI